MSELVTSLQCRPTTYIFLKVFLDVGVMVIVSILNCVAECHKLGVGAGNREFCGPL
jgi:hypothetical protein